MKGRRYLALAALLVLSVAQAGPDLALTTQLDRLTGEGWQVHGVELTFKGPALGQGRLELRAERLELPQITLSTLRLDCSALELAPDRLTCAGGRLRAQAPGSRALDAEAGFSYSAAGHLTFSLDKLALAGGRVGAQGQVDAVGWSLTLNGERLDAAALAELLQPLLTFPITGNRGRIDGQVTVAASAAEPVNVGFKLGAKGLAWSAGGGRYAAEGLDATLEGRWRGAGRFSGNLNLEAGQAYLDPVLLDLSEARPLSVRLSGRLEEQRLELDIGELRHGHFLALGGRLTLDLEQGQLADLELNLEQARLPTVYRRYLQTPLTGTVLGDLTTDGLVRGRLVLDDRGLKELDLRLAAVNVEDGQGRFGAQGLDGRLAWGRGESPRRSELSWRQGHVYRIDLGPANLALESRGGAFWLPGIQRLPVLDGTLVIERLEGQGLGSGAAEFQFDGQLHPVSMGALSAALDWPPLAGKLSGVIPGVRYRDGVLEVGGALLTRIFDGDITFTRLRLEDPLGIAPRAYAEVDIRDLDLETLTRAFDVGKISGKLEGRIDGLVLGDWQPVAFDARLYTPPGDHSRRRISQRAVQAISALGGANAAAVLSRGFLSLFDEFNYRRLGIRCRLARGVCEMNGVAPAPQGGYYLVEGQGLPRIDVIGYTRQVDWAELLARLQAAMHSEGPVIQ